MVMEIVFLFGFLAFCINLNTHKMKNLLIIFTISVFTISCNHPTDDASQVKTDSLQIKQNLGPFSPNELKLISSFDSIQTAPYSLYDLRDSTDEKLQTVLTDSSCCQYIRLNVNQAIDSIHSIKLSNNYYHNCGDCGCILKRHFCSILLNSKGQILFNGALIKTSDLRDSSFSYYSNIGTSISYPENMRKHQFYIQWDYAVKKEVFDQFIIQIIEAYLDIVKLKSQEIYQTNIEDLSHKQLLKLAKKNPFNIKIARTIIVTDEDIDDLEID
jgi:hypothetical protein